MFLIIDPPLNILLYILLLVPALVVLVDGVVLVVDGVVSVIIVVGFNVVVVPPADVVGCVFVVIISGPENYMHHKDLKNIALLYTAQNIFNRSTTEHIIIYTFISTSGGSVS